MLRIGASGRMLMERTAPRFAGASFDVGWIGACGWLAACLTLIAVYGVLLVSPWSYHFLLQEDGWVENLTAVAILLAGMLLFAAAWTETRRFPRFVLLAGSMVMAFVVGEEISWGQRILGFATPDFMSRNTQGEFNVHNLPGLAALFLNKSLGLFMKLLCLTTAAALFSRKVDLFGVPLPSLPLLLLLLSIPYGKIPAAHFADDEDVRFWFALFSHWRVVVLVLFAAWALFCKRPALVLAAAATLMLCLARFHVIRHNFIPFTGEPFIGEPLIGELREFLAGLFWLCYAGELLHGVRRHNGWSSSAAVTVADERRGAFPLLPAISWLALAGGAGLLALTHFDVRMERPELEAARRAVRFADPDIRAAFNLHLTDGQLTYVKEPCAQTDADDASLFFLHVFPEDLADIPGHRRQYGFDNLDFRFVEHGARIRGSCVAVASLPDYPIVSIRTGQLRGGQQLWNAQLLAAE